MKDLLQVYLGVAFATALYELYLGYVDAILQQL